MENKLKKKINIRFKYIFLAVYLIYICVLCLTRTHLAFGMLHIGGVWLKHKIYLFF